VSKETFENRLNVMQQRMEEQLVEQLKTLETKIGSPGGVVKGGAGAFVDETTVELLRGEIAKKVRSGACKEGRTEAGSLEGCRPQN
jgi:hypothetical protein